jgi:hypothetical protein
MTTLVGISTEPSCLIYAFSASAKDLRPALIAGLIRGVSGFGLFMRQLLEFVTKTIHQIPDFSATQTTARFNKSVEGREESALVPNWSFQAAKTVTETAFFHTGYEIANPVAAKSSKSHSELEGLITPDFFGSILGKVLMDAAQSTLGWSHWEEGASGPQAVFRYSVPVEKSHYQVIFCCSPWIDGDHIFRRTSSYHGEIAVDPTTGAILRLTVLADIKSDILLLDHSNLLIEYGNVQIAGKSYICPVKSISVVTANKLVLDSFEATSIRGGPIENHAGSGWLLRTFLDEVVFDQFQPSSSSAPISAGDQAGKD